ncbi:multidrug/biocide efflux PACE transporter [Metakosakonia massiliensis]|uniref:Bacterial Transmembrane Pair family protein n=1 Tax=Phytobacter massiliensis TaxID=1485952 RepID=A0A6N3G2F9_9ENTR|nr:multidrug/biocide efflux PACE transporter [Phytobacter massiliensis]
MQRTTERKSLMERVFHAVCFELIAIAICAPVSAWILQRPMLEMGTLTLILSTAAMIWNVIYNAGFDRLWPVHRVPRTLVVRVWHALGFEGGFIVIGVTIASMMLGISLVAAFVLEIGFFLFFLPYTMLFNWVWDLLRARLKQRQARACRE